MTNKKKLEETQKKLFDSRELIAGSIVLFIGILIGSFWLSGLAESVSKLAATLGSLATAATLVFVINQNNQLRRNQEKEEAKREEHESKQQKMWAEQEKMLTFQKYQNHKVLLNEILIELENELPVKIIEKTKLYRKLFPQNNSEYCDVKIPHLSTLYGASRLALLDTLYHDLCTFFTNFKSMQLEPVVTIEADIAAKIYDDYLTKLYQFSQQMHVEFTHLNSTGSTYLHNKSENIISNIFDATQSFEHLESIYLNISHFCGNEKDKLKNYKSTSFSIAKLLHFFDDAHHHNFTVNKGDVSNSLELIYQYFMLLSHDDLINSHSINRETIITFFDDSENLDMNINNYCHLPSILRVLLDSTSEITNNTGLEVLNESTKKQLAMIS